MINNIIKRLSRRYDSDILEAMLFNSVGASEINSTVASQWLTSATEAANDKFNGTRNYSAQLKELEGDDWAVQITRRMHGVDTNYFFNKDFFASPESKHIFELNQKLDGLLNDKSYIQRGERKEYVSRFDNVI